MKFFPVLVCGVCTLLFGCTPQSENTKMQENPPSGMPVSPGAGPLTPIPDVAEGVEGSGGGVENVAKERAKSIASSPPSSASQTADSDEY